MTTLLEIPQLSEEEPYDLGASIFSTFVCVVLAVAFCSWIVGVAKFLIKKIRGGE